MYLTDPQPGSNRQLKIAEGCFNSPPRAPKSNGPSAGAEHRGRLGLESTEWLRLPLQPPASNSGALLTFAHCPNFKLQAA
jgi:hypothetical protein